MAQFVGCWEPWLKFSATTTTAGRSSRSHIKARHVRAAKSDPYEVLGIAPDIDDDTLKRHYRKLVLDNHPDGMIARGVPPEFVSFATKKIAAINAYQEVAKERRT